MNDLSIQLNLKPVLACFNFQFIENLAIGSVKGVYVERFLCGKFQDGNRFIGLIAGSYILQIGKCRITERDYSRPVFSEPDLKFSLHPARATTTLSGVS